MRAARLGVMKGGICVDNIEQEGKDGEEKRKTAPDSTLHPSADAGQKVRLLMGQRRLLLFFVLDAPPPHCHGDSPCMSYMSPTKPCDIKK